MLIKTEYRSEVNRVRFTGRGSVRTRFSDWNVVPRFVDPGTCLSW